MNAIESRFFNSFIEYISKKPCFSVFNSEVNYKIADCQVLNEETEVDNDEGLLATIIMCDYVGMGKLNRHLLARLELESQVNIGPYKVDFSLCISTDNCLNNPQMAIEIDGHEWHEKHKEQAANDKRRDRELAARDVTVLRFTGSEVYTNPEKCIEEILKAYVAITCYRSETVVAFSDLYHGALEDLQKLGCKAEIEI